MLAAIGLSLPIALGLLFVSMPMAVIVLVMITAGAHRGAASFLLGWVLGISAVVAVTIVIADYSRSRSRRGLPCGRASYESCWVWSCSAWHTSSGARVRETGVSRQFRSG